MQLNQRALGIDTGVVEIAMALLTATKELDVLLGHHLCCPVGLEIAHVPGKRGTDAALQVSLLMPLLDGKTLYTVVQEMHCVNHTYAGVGYGRYINLEDVLKIAATVGTTAVWCEDCQWCGCVRGGMRWAYAGQVWMQRCRATARGSSVGGLADICRWAQTRTKRAGLARMPRQTGRCVLGMVYGDGASTTTGLSACFTTFVLPMHTRSFCDLQGQ